MRMIDVNIFNTIETLRLTNNSKLKKYFCVSTDKAANPVNMMGASKRIMEMFLMRRSLDINVSTARFANVAFSDGSLHILNSNYRTTAIVKFDDLFPIGLTSLEFEATDTDVNYFTAEVVFKYTVYNIVASDGRTPL